MKTYFFMALVFLNCAALAQEKYQRHPSAYDALPLAKKGGDVYLRITNNPKVMNPILSNDSNSSALDGYFFASLMDTDPNTLEPLPYLADSYEISSDRKHYTFFLNPHAKWEDGSSITADDVVFTFSTIMNPKVEAAPLRSYYDGISVEKKDSRTVRFTVSDPKFDTLRTLYGLSPIQKKQFAAVDDFNKSPGILQPVTSGPYRLKNFSRDQSVTLERKVNWWGSQIPHLKNQFNAATLVLRIITDESLAYERFIKGELDVTSFTAEQYASKVLGADKDRIAKSAADAHKRKTKVWAKEVKNKAARGFQYIGWNLRNPLFADPKVRNALAHLVDYQQINDKVFYGYVVQASSPFGSFTQNSDPQLRTPGILKTYDRKRGIQLLREAGWSDSDRDNVIDKVINGKKTPFRFTLKFNSNNPQRAKIAQVIKENFRASGIDVQVASMEWNAFLDDVDNRRFDAVVLAWTGTNFPNAKQIWHTDSQKDQGSNFIGYSNKAVDELIDKSNATFDLKARAPLMQQINRLIYADQPYLFLTEQTSLLAGFNEKVRSQSGVWAYDYDVAPALGVFEFLP